METKHFRHRAVAVVAGLLVIIVVLISIRPTRRSHQAGDDAMRLFQVRDLALNFQFSVDHHPGARAFDEARTTVEGNGSQLVLSTGEVLRYELVAGYGSYSAENLATTVLLREASVHRDGRRAVAFADGRAAFVAD